MRSRARVLEAAIIEALDLLEQIPSGIDRGADPENLSPEDAVAHVAGLVWQRLDAVIAGRGELR